MNWERLALALLAYTGGFLFGDSHMLLGIPVLVIVGIWANCKQ